MDLVYIMMCVFLRREPSALKQIKIETNWLWASTVDCCVQCERKIKTKQKKRCHWTSMEEKKRRVIPFRFTFNVNVFEHKRFIFIYRFIISSFLIQSEEIKMAHLMLWRINIFLGWFWNIFFFVLFSDML